MLPDRARTLRNGQHAPREHEVARGPPSCRRKIDNREPLATLARHQSTARDSIREAARPDSVLSMLSVIRPARASMIHVNTRLHMNTRRG